MGPEIGPDVSCVMQRGRSAAPLRVTVPRRLVPGDTVHCNMQNVLGRAARLPLHETHGLRWLDGVGWKLRRVKERLAATDGGLVLRKDLGAALIDAGLATKVPTVVCAAANRDVKAGGIAAACVDTLLAAGAQIGVRRCQSRRTSRRDGRWGFGWRGFWGPVAASKYRQGNPE